MTDADLGRLDVVGGAQRERGVDAGMAVAAGRIRLHRRMHQFEHGAEVLHRAGRVRVGRVGVQEAVAALQRLGGTLEALAHQRGGHQPVARRPADLETLGPGAVGQELQAAGALAQHRAQRAFDLLGGQAEHPRGGGGGTEGAAGGGGVEAAVVVLAGGQCQGDAAGDLVAGDDAGQHVGARCADHLAGREGRRDHRRAGMQRTGGVRVVEVERMRQRAIQERGAGGRVAGGVAEHAGIARRHAHGAHRGEERRRAFGVVSRADDVADQVEHQETRALHHLGRQPVQADVGGELREVCGDAHRNGSSSVAATLAQTAASEQDCGTAAASNRRPEEEMSGTTQKVPHRTLITLCVMMGNLMQSLDASIANVSLPYMQGTLSTSADEITWVLTSYVIAAAIMTAPVGWMAVGSGGRTCTSPAWRVWEPDGYRPQVSNLHADGGRCPSARVKRLWAASCDGHDAGHQAFRLHQQGFATALCSIR